MVRRAKDWTGSGEDKVNTVKQRFRRTYRLREFERILYIIFVSCRSMIDSPPPRRRNPYSKPAIPPIRLQQLSRKEPIFPRLSHGQIGGRETDKRQLVLTVTPDSTPPATPPAINETSGVVTFFLPFVPLTSPLPLPSLLLFRPIVHSFTDSQHHSVS